MKCSTTPCLPVQVERSSIAREAGDRNSSRRGVRPATEHVGYPIEGQTGVALINLVPEDVGTSLRLLLIPRVRWKSCDFNSILVVCFVSL